MIFSGEEIHPARITHRTGTKNLFINAYEQHHYKYISERCGVYVSELNQSSNRDAELTVKHKS